MQWLAATPPFSSHHASRIADLTAGSEQEDFFYDPQIDLLSTELFPGEKETAEQVKLLHDIFGNPFRPVTFDAAWRTETAVAIAERMYRSREFDAMPILADSLEDAGCDNEDILRHCREPGVHVRSCWVVDRVLGKE